MKYIKQVLLFFFLLSSHYLSAELQSDIVIQKYKSGVQNYIELYTYIINPYKQDSLKSSRNIESLIVISDEEKIILAEKYLYRFSPDLVEDVIDVKKFQLDPGVYTVRVELIDLEDINLYKDHTTKITIPEVRNSISTSDLYLGFQSKTNSPSLVKSGIPIEPMVFDFCRNQENLMVYLEGYNLDQTDQTIFAGFRLNRKIGADSLELVFKKYEKLKNEPFYPLLTQFPMKDVISGSYEFTVELINKDSEVLQSLNRSFDVSNAEADLHYEMSYNLDFENSWVQDLDNAQLEYSLKAIFPKLSFTSTDVVNYILDQKDLKVKRYFLYNFWVGQSEQFPEQLYHKYMEIARAVDKTYQKNVGFGFESDRGYIFLKYGKPNNIVTVEDEPSAPPYEIWIYNYLTETNQTDVKFLFYNKSLAANDMQLLHSTVRGEYSNPRWELELYGDDPNTAKINQIDGRSATPGFNRRAREYFSDF